MTEDSQTGSVPKRRRAAATLSVDTSEAERLRAVAALGQRALIVTDLSVLMQEAVALVTHVLGVDQCQILEMLPSGDALAARAAVGMNEELVHRVAIGGDTESLLGFTLLDAAPVIVDNLVGETRFRQNGIRPSDRAVSSISMRLQGQERPLGVIAAYSIVPRRFSESDVYFVQAVAHVIAIAIERKRAEQKTAALLQVARDISGTAELEVLFDRAQRRTAEILGCDRVCTFSWDATRAAFRLCGHHGFSPAAVADAEQLEFRRGEPIIESIWEGDPLVINDGVEQTLLPGEILSHFGIASLVIAPLVVRGPLTGALVAMRTQKGHRFDTGQVQLLEAIASQLAVAVDAAVLLRTQREEADLSAALVRVGRELISSLDTPRMLDRLSQLTCELLECDWSNTWLSQPPDGSFVIASTHGHNREQTELLQLVKFPRSMATGELAHVAQTHGLLQLTKAQFSAVSFPTLGTQIGATVVMYVPLVRGQQVVGMLVAGYRGREQPFTPQQERMAQGIAHLVSLALDRARAVDEIERANRLKSDFLATMSHELRTPLNVILGYNQLMLDHAFGDLAPEQTDTAQRINRNANRLLELINATLDVGRLEAGRLPIELEEVSVTKLIAELDADTQELQRKPNVTFTWNVAADLPPLDTDRVKLKIVLKNLIANALKFTERGSVVTHARPGVQDDRPGIQFRVDDTGPGIPPDVLPIIFEPFRQGDSSITRQHGGAGLGLYIARRLLELLGGSLAVDSAVGHGSSFHVWVPIQHPAPPPTTADEAP